MAENGGSQITQDDVEMNVAKRRGENAMADILEHQPHYWTARTKKQVTDEGYNAEFVAQELALQGLTLADETLPKEKKGKAEKVEPEEKAAE